MLTAAQIDEHSRVGALVVPDILTAEETRRLRAVTDDFVERARAVTAHDDVYDLEDSDRRLLLLQFRAADAWPLLGFPAGLAAYDALMVSGKPSIEPRLEPVPVRLAEAAR